MPSRNEHRFYVKDRRSALLSRSVLDVGSMIVQGRPINLFVTAGQVSDYIGTRALLSSLPSVEWLLGGRGYDADWFREALQDKGIRPCIPGRKSRAETVRYDKRRYKRRNRIEIMFGRLKDWRRVATRYDRCPKVFLSAIALAATVIYWLGVLSQGELGQETWATSFAISVPVCGLT